MWKMFTLDFNFFIQRVANQGLVVFKPRGLNIWMNSWVELCGAITQWVQDWTRLTFAQKEFLLLEFSRIILLLRERKIESNLVEICVWLRQIWWICRAHIFTIGKPESQILDKDWNVWESQYHMNLPKCDESMKIILDHYFCS